MAKASKRQDLIPHTVDNSIFHQRNSDGYINATEFCHAHGRRVSDFLDLTSTQEYIKYLNTRKSGIIEVVYTQKGKGGGTWLHPKLAVHLGQWISVEMMDLVSEIVIGWMTGTLKPKKPTIDKTSQERLDTIPYTKNLRDAIHQKINEADKWIYLNVENAVHKAITGMSATHHKKQVQHSNGVDLLCKREMEVFNIIKELFYIELGKYENNSLSGEEIRRICDEACVYGEQIVSMHEGRGLMDAHRHANYLPVSKNKLLKMGA